MSVRSRRAAPPDVTPCTAATLVDRHRPGEHLDELRQRGLASAVLVMASRTSRPGLSLGVPGPGPSVRRLLVLRRLDEPE